MSKLRSNNSELDIYQFLPSSDSYKKINPELINESLTQPFVASNSSSN